MKKLGTIFIACLLCATAVAQEAPEGLFINSKAPDFKGVNQYGEEVRLKDVLKKGKKVVLVFYRGFWCPYCNKELKTLQDSLQTIAEKGAELIAVSPEKPESMDSTVSKTGATFSIICDTDLKIMNDYKVAFEMQQKDINRYKLGGIDLEQINGKDWKSLPIPAVYIINNDQTITYRYFNSNYRKRPSVKEIASNL